MGQLEDMALFAKIVESGSITGAADHLGLAKSAVSKRLSDLEESLGVQLLNRTTRKSSLTEAGQRFYTQSQKILADTDEMLNEIGQEGTSLTGNLRIAAPLSFGIKHLSPVVSRFAANHPGLTVDLDFADRQVNLVEEGFDVAIRIAELESSSLIAKRFTTIRHILCASPTYLEKHPAPKHPKDLDQHRILRYKSPSGLAHQLKDANGQSFDLTGKTALISNNGDFLRQAAKDGLGIYFCPSFICYEELKSGQLMRLLPEFSATELGAYILYPRTRYLSSRVRTFIDHVTNSFSQHPYWDEGLF
ncbi:LysR family transcriptional regulator [Sneathiella limimaris]|uniref:LysR family transcriptional regulator n=1 Tax=Sneathiella limimaris TaxID=1964213 RepID=UPI00146A256C|nr:LysR family transcriptional regulator [Sneathiella limimaris]